MNPELNRELKYIEDKSFVDWVKSGFTIDNDKWQPLQNDVKVQDDITKAIAIVEMLHFDVVRMPSEKKKVLYARINESTQDNPIQDKSTQEGVSSTIKIDRVRTNKNRIWVLGIAASFLLLIFAFWPSNSAMQINTDFAELEKVNLPDNSTVVVNAKSQLKFDKSDYKEIRKLDLDGEAFFEVEKGKPFTVNTKLGMIEVLGTSFNVFSRDNQFEVVCETGKVQVTLNKSKKAIELTPGERCYLEAGNLLKSQRTQKSDQWIGGLFHFEGDQLKDVIAEMERQFNVKFETNDVDISVKYNGFFNKKEFDKSLESVFWPLKIKFEKSADNKRIILKK
jgi:ferric-dicitrate binding protein FerR (iron transport regulator)